MSDSWIRSREARVSAEDLSAKVGFVAEFDGTSAFQLCDGPTDQATVRQRQPAGIIVAGGGASGDVVDVVAKGYGVYCSTGAAVTKGDLLIAEYNTGQVIPVGSPLDDDYTVGMALETASGADELILCDIYIQRHHQT